MPWLVGEGEIYRSLPKREGLFPLHEMLSLEPLAYIGYLHPGFSLSLERGAFRPGRVVLALQGGWRAVAVTAAVKDKTKAKLLAPFVAPTWAGPHRVAPLGFTLFSSAWLSRVLPLGELGVSRSSLEWSRRMVGLLDEKNPVFCDPELELELEVDEDDEMSAQDPYRAPRPTQRAWKAVSALSVSSWEMRTP